MKRTMIFCMAALLAANFACGGGKGPVDPPPPPVPPSLTLDPANPTTFTVPGKIEVRFTSNATSCIVTANRTMSGDVLTPVNSCGHWNYEASQVGSGTVRLTVSVTKDGLTTIAHLDLQLKAVAPTITPDPTNSLEWVVSSTQTMKYTVSPTTSICTAAHDNTEPIAGMYQNRTLIQSTTGSGVTVVVQNSIFKGKPTLSVAVTCVNGSSAATSTSFNYPLVSGKLVISGITVVRSVASNGSVLYESTFTGSGFSAYNGDSAFSYTGTLCGSDGRTVSGTGWTNSVTLVIGIGGGPDFNWSGTHTYRCVNPNPKGSEASITFVVP